jgi:hypothetical protein
MAPQFSDPPPLATPATWPGAAAKPAVVAPDDTVRRLPESLFARRLRLAGTVLAAILALVLLAAWLVPPMLDWGRFRGAIAAIASAQLGRPVVIGGEVTLRLLPEAVLTATDVSLPAEPESGGDTAGAASAQLAALRLQVAIWPLMTGRIVLRDLVLGTPVITLPWPLPDRIAHPIRPHLPHAFAAHVENGSLRIGGVTVSRITAAIHGGPVVSANLAAPPAGAEVAPPSAFGAEGFASFGGRNWRFASALGAPDADGVSAIDLSMNMLRQGGVGDIGDTGGAIQATLAEGVVQGRLKAAGPDLSLLLPQLLAGRLAWQAEAPFVATGERIETRAARLVLGGSPSEGTLDLRLGAAARLDGAFTAARLDLDSWGRLLRLSARRGQASGDIATGLDLRITLAAQTASLFGGDLRDLRADLRSDGKTLSLDQAEAALPGGARLSFGVSALRAAQGQIFIRAPAALEAPDLRATLAWLQPLAPALARALPQAAGPAPLPTHAALHGVATFSPGAVQVTALAGTVDGVQVAGELGLRLGERPWLSLDLALDRLDADPWLGDPAALRDDGLAAFGQRFTGLDADLRVAAAQASWHGMALSGVRLAARAREDGLHLDRLELAVDSARLTAAGAIGANGAITGGQLRAQAPDLAPVLAALPAAWRAAPALWRGPGSLAVTADGPADALALALRAEASDVLMEVEATRDTQHGLASATVTLRHPGAPRLLADLGIAGAQSWLGTGSVAMLAHARQQPGVLLVQDFAINAADLRLGGQAALSWGRADGPVLGARVHAEMLALPGAFEIPGQLSALFATGGPWSRLAAHVVLGASAAEIGPLQGLTGLRTTLDLAHGMLLAPDLTATLAGGALTARIAADTTRTPPVMAMQGELTGAVIDHAMAELPIDLTAGTWDGAFDAEMAGATPAAALASLSGQVSVRLRDGDISGFDMAQLRHVPALKPSLRAAAARAALSHGDTPGASGEIKAVLSAGHATLPPARLVTPEGVVILSGAAELQSGALDLGFAVTPAASAAGSQPATSLLRLTGDMRNASVASIPARTPPPRRGHPARAKNY